MSQIICNLLAVPKLYAPDVNKNGLCLQFLDQVLKNTHTISFYVLKFGKTVVQGLVLVIISWEIFCE